QYARALTDVTEAIRLDPTDDGHLATRARVYLAMGDHQRAIADLTAALGIDGSDARHYAARALANMKARRPARAYLDVQRALQMGPDAPELMEMRGRVLEA